MGDRWPEGGEPSWYFYGKPNAVHSPFTVCYESELDYLDRLGLLTEDERHAITVANITNEEI
ncbi:MAG: hypothetical protein U0836_20595 [Pirellulales bacterium]